jgi:outer membrane protein
LAQTLQLDPAQSFEVTYPVIGEDLNRFRNMSLDSLISVAMANRSDLKQLDHQAKANKFAYKSALAPALPSVSLFANYGSFYYSLIAQDFSGQFGTIQSVAFLWRESHRTHLRTFSNEDSSVPLLRFSTTTAF